jgi:hypothetical protein
MRSTTCATGGDGWKCADEARAESIGCNVAGGLVEGVVADGSISEVGKTSVYTTWNGVDAVRAAGDGVCGSRAFS